jgi:hypothetical protein
MIHSTRLKRIVNPVLRKLQFWTDKPFVIYSTFENDKFIRYGFGRVWFQ